MSTLRAPSLLDLFTYRVEPGDEVDPALWLVTRVGSPPDIDGLSPHGIRMHTGATANNRTSLLCKQAIMPSSVVNRTRCEWKGLLEEAVSATTFEMGLGAPNGYAYAWMVPEARVYKGTTSGTIKFRTTRNAATGNEEITDNIADDPTVEHTYMIEVIASPLKIRLYVDGVLRAEHTLAVSTDASAPYFTVETTAAADKHLVLRYVSMAGIIRDFDDGSEL